LHRFKDIFITIFILSKRLIISRKKGVVSVWTRIDWTRATHSAWTVESL